MKKKRENKTKEQILNEMVNSKDFQERLSFLRDQFYPKVIGASKNIEDAKMFLQSIVTVMMEKFLAIMKETSFSQLQLIEALDPKDPKYEEYVLLLDIFKDMNVFEARGHFERMKSEIDRFILDEMQERPLDTLKTKWVDEVIKNNEQKPDK